MVELLVAIAILGIIMVIALPQLSGLKNDNKNTKYEKYSDSIVTSAKLYTDSYAKDMFGNNTSGCYDIPYKKLEEKNLAKDIRIDDLTCDTYNGTTPTTFVRVFKSQDVFLYDIAIKCVDKNNKVVYEKTLNGDICNGKRSDDAGPEITISGISAGWTTGRDSSGNPLKATVTIEDSYGLKENIKFLYAWTKDVLDLDSLTYKTHSFTNSRDDVVRTLSHDIEYPQNENGVWHLVIKPGPDGIRDLNGNYNLETHVVSPEVKLDNTPPVITNLVNSKDGEWTNQPVTVSGSISDNHSGVKKIYYSYKSDGSDKTAFGTSQITSGGKGPFNVSKKWSSNMNEKIYIIGEDSVGNKTAVLAAGKIMIDNDVPTCSIKLTGTSGDNGWYKSGNVTVTLNKSDAYSDIASYGLATTSSATYNSTASATQGDTAGITWYGYVKDKAGNTASCSKNFKVDATKPSCTISKSGTSGNNGWYKSSVSLTLNPSDALSGVAQTGLGTSTSPTLGSTKTGTQVETGNITWYGRVKDNAGNISDVCNSGAFKVDTTKPSCTITFSGTTGTNGWYTSNATVKINPSDALSGVGSIGLSTSTSATYNNASSSTQANTAGQRWNGYVMDAAGNVNSCYNSVKVDTTKPSCTISKSGTAGNNGWYTSNVSLTLNSTDELSGVAQTGLGTSTSPTLGSTKTGTQTETTGVTWYGRVKDNAGNISETCNSGSFKVDTTKPSISWNTGEGPHNNSSGITVTTSCTDSTSGVASHTGSSSVGSPTTGTTKTHSCTDNAGNSSSTSRTFKVKTYGRDSSCGIESYNSCRNSACGIESYNSCADSVCGVSVYKSCQSSACGKVCASGYEMNSSGTSCYKYNYTSPTYKCPSNTLDWGSGICYGLWDKSTCERSCGGTAPGGYSKEPCGIAYGYVWCTADVRRPIKSCSSGSLTSDGNYCYTTSYSTPYNATCRNSSCGVESYKSCPNANCGVAQYVSCRTEACGIESYKECWHY